MATLRCNKVSRERGFTMVEVLFSIIILTVGLVSLAALMSKMDMTTNQSRYMGNVVLMTSEKLEGLARLSSSDPVLAAGGSLTTDVAGYNDQVAASVGDGTFQEQIAGDYDPSTGKAVTEIYTQGPDGVLYTDKPLATNVPAFKRRWLIEDSPAGFPAGVKRITVFVTAPAVGAGLPATFQMSMVRYVPKS
jgi:prepilin-type N-terminal cleavage/methylation domain-containing protein